MKITEMNWMQVEAYLQRDDRTVVPIGSTEQHAGLMASHASWMENFPWTRVPGAQYPDEQKPVIDAERFRLLDPTRARELLGDGNFGGRYQRPEEEMQALWRVAVDETRDLIAGPWA